MNEEIQTRKNIKTLKVFGRELHHNRCSCIAVRIQSVKFPNLKIQDWFKDDITDNLISLTEMKVIEEYNIATEVEFMVKERVLKITTDDYIYFVQFDKEQKV